MYPFYWNILGYNLTKHVKMEYVSSMAQNIANLNGDKNR